MRCYLLGEGVQSSESHGLNATEIGTREEFETQTEGEEEEGVGAGQVRRD